MMLTKGIAYVIKEIEKLPKHPKTNEKRMQYHQYLERDYSLVLGP
ncbi:hypothetical protein [Aquimarina sp. RZ0]|nr:hypothetical protein [Aquimarina sp. RZ0]